MKLGGIAALPNFQQMNEDIDSQGHLQKLFYLCDHLEDGLEHLVVELF